jgi:organic radical activating enzyme
MTRSFYCSNKFKFLKIDLERQMTYNCHAAAPHRVDFNWLSNNPGNIFNIPVNIAEREMMLLNQRNLSCEQNCWPAEDRNQVSVRQLEDGIDQTHTLVHTQPEVLDITLDSDCNLSCIYCCKEYSSAWRRDIKDNGPYVFDHADQDLINRFKFDNKDIVLTALSQKDKQTGARYQKLLTEVDSIIPNLKLMIVTGGEPMLSSQLVDILNKAQNVPEIKIFTGLGIKSSRLEKILKEINSTNNIVFAISAENTQDFYEFVRAGNSYNNFLTNLKIIQESGVRYKFHSTLSNLTLMGFFDFYHEYKQHDIEIDFCYTPDFLSVHVLDHTSKEIIKEQWSSVNNDIANKIISSIDPMPTALQTGQLRSMLTQFSQRKQLDINIFSQHFLDWIQP